MSSASPHHRVSHPQHYHNNSPTTTLSEDDSNSEPNDLRTTQKIRHHSAATFPGYPFFSPPQHNSGSIQSQHSQHSSGQQYVATNECRLIEYRGARIAAFLSANRSQCEYLLCLPQAFELFLKHLVGGLHTVYTKLKRLDIVPIVCNVEQVRILRGLGAIQPGVNRCKLLSTSDFDTLYKDCTTARPGRPPKRSTGIVSPVPASFTSGPQQHNVVPYLGFPTAKKPRFSDDTDYGSENLDLKQHNSAVNTNTNGNNTSAATAAAMLAANGYSAAFPFLQHLSAGTTPTPQQQQQLVAAAAALGLPGLPPRFSNTSPPPAIAPHHGNNGNNTTSDSGGVGADFNPTAAYLWLLSQQQQQQIPNSAALNLSSRNTNVNSTGNNNLNNTNNINNNNISNSSNNNTNNNNTNTSNANNTPNNTNNNTNNSNNNNSNNNNNSGTVNNHNINANANDDDSTDDDDDEDDVESNNSSTHSDNPVSSSGFNGISCGRGAASETASNRNSSTTPPHHSQQQQSQPPEHCLETLLRNIEGLLAIAAHNARQQQTQLHLQKAELRAELAAQLEREREMREHLEKQLNEEQKIRMLYQKRFKKERRFRRKVEHELHQQQHQQHQQHQQQQQISTNKQQITQNTQQVSLKSSPTPSPQQQQQQQPQQQTETID